MSGAETISLCDLFLGFPAGSGPGEVNMGVEELDVTSSACLVVSCIGACDLDVDPAACFSGFKLGSTPLFAPCTGGGAAIPAAALCTLVITFSSAIILLNSAI